MIVIVKTVKEEVFEIKALNVIEASGKLKKMKPKYEKVKQYIRSV